MDRANDEGEEIMWGMIRGEVGVAGGEPSAGEDAREDVANNDEVSSFLNLSGEGLELEPVDEGQTNNDDEGNVIVRPSTTTGEVYIY